MSTPLVITLGCRLNASESEAMRSQADAAGLHDTVIVNTCAVTAEAVRQARQAIRKARREHPDARIVVTGCAAQTEPETFAAMGEVDHVLGNEAKTRPATYAALATAGLERVVVDDIMAVRETAPHLLGAARLGSRVRAFLQIQNGCDHRCTFCVIPFGRGPSRSVPAGAVVAEVGRLVEAGVREIVLTGVDLTAWGGDLPGGPTLGRLVRQILRHVPGLERLRLSSIDQFEADDHLLGAIAEEERLMPHLHLSLQAGDDLILKRMKRRHTRRQAVEFCQRVRRLRPDIAFGADLIAGFPTETEAAFSNTQALIEDCGLVFLHVFPYSARSGTPAARMPQVPHAVVKDRAGRLRAHGQTAHSRWLAAQRGRVAKVLIERDDRGHTEQFAEVVVAGAGRRAGTQAVRIVGDDGRRLVGEIAA